MPKAQPRFLSNHLDLVADSTDIVTPVPKHGGKDDRV